MESKKVFLDKLTHETIAKAFATIKADPEFAVPGCHYEIAREARHKDVLDFIRYHFKPDEPMGRSIAHVFPWNDELEGLWSSVLQQNVSLILSSDSPEDVVAVCVSAIFKKNKPGYQTTAKSEGLKKMLHMLMTLGSMCDVYKHYGVDEYISFVALGVHRDYRRRGVGLKVQKAAVAMATNFEIRPVLLEAEGTSMFSQMIYEKLGFDILAEIF